VESELALARETQRLEQSKKPLKRLKDRGRWQFTQLNRLCENSLEYPLATKYNFGNGFVPARGMDRRIPPER
jgi:hypothetical protein